MNNHPNHTNRHNRRNYRRPRGQSMAEMAVTMPVLALLLLAATDFGRLYYANIEVANAARAGAQYGSQSLTAAADKNGMKTAATNDAPSLSGLSVTPSQCTCMASTVVAACPTNYCTNNPNATFVEVDTGTTFSTLINYPGVPCPKVGGKCTYTLKGKAVMRVQS